MIIYAMKTYFIVNVIMMIWYHKKYSILFKL